MTTQTLTHKFPRESRLCSPSAFARVRRKGRHFRTPLFTVSSVHSQQSPRLGLVVSKKVGSAPVRNRIKRRFRHLFRTHSVRFSSIDLVVIAHKGLDNLGYQALQSQFLRAITFLERPQKSKKGLHKETHDGIKP